MEEELDKNNGRDMTPKLLGETWRKYPTDTSKQKATYGLFQCQYCGKEFECQTSHIKNGSTKSCGCYINIERLREAQTTHGMSQNKFYLTWYGMLQRCTNTMRQDYKDYGARGITVCEEWLDVANFVAWCELTNPNIEGYSLVRIDNNKGYSPENCRWVDKSTQVINQRMKKNNTSGFVGVGNETNTKKWRARINIMRESIHIGTFNTIEEAVQARDQYILDNKLPNKLSTDYK